MTLDRKSLRLFTLGSDIDGSPDFVEPASFTSLGAEELKDIERWIKKEPGLLGEELCIVASQFSDWDKTNDRPDLLALDRAGKLVVIEIKRDKSGKDQNLQGIRYASYASGLSSDDVVALFRSYRAKEHDQELSDGDAADLLNDFIAEGGIEALDDDDNPRIILVAAQFQAGVTSTVLWLRRTFTMDVSCVQVQPYKLEGEIVLASTTLIPLPEAAEYEVRVREKRLKAASKKLPKLDETKAADFIASIPEGRWASYEDVAAAGGRADLARHTANLLSGEGWQVPLVYRVLKKSGKVSPGWKAANPGLPQSPEEVRVTLLDEGVEFSGQRASKAQRWTPDDWLAAIEEEDHEPPAASGNGVGDALRSSAPQAP